MKRLVVLMLGFWAIHLGVSAGVPYDASSEMLRNGRVVYDVEAKAQDYRLVLSAIRRVNNQWRTVNEQRVRGLVERMTFELAATDYAQARQALMRDIEALGSLQVMFQCEGHDCGSSNGWANEFLQVKQLYGLDRYQLYMVLRGLDRSQREMYLVYYLVQRGNGRIYLQQDVIYSKPSTEEFTAIPQTVWLERLRNNGFLVVPGVVLEGEQLQIADGGIDLVAQLIQQLPTASFHLVGHDYQPGTSERRHARSLGHAQMVRDRLVAQGVPAARIAVHGLGHLAPAGRTAPARVELVLD